MDDLYFIDNPTVQDYLDSDVDVQIVYISNLVSFINKWRDMSVNSQDVIDALKVDIRRLESTDTPLDDLVILTFRRFFPD